MRSADSWIGVSGFLISCASRRADLTPGGDLLRADERRDVVQHEDTALVVTVGADQARDRGRDVQVAPLANHGHLLRERIGLARAPPDRARR